MFSMIRKMIVLLLATISLNALLAMEETSQSPEFKPTETALVLANGSSGELFAGLQAWWLACDREAAFVQVITAEPGPAQLDSGVRILGNSVFPKVTMPRWLIVSLDGELKADFVLHAFLRRALKSDVEVWLVTESLPGILNSPDLRNAKGLRVLSPEYAVLAIEALAAQCAALPKAVESEE